MKKIILLISIVTVLFACKKEIPAPQTTTTTTPSPTNTASFNKGAKLSIDVNSNHKYPLTLIRLNNNVAIQDFNNGGATQKAVPFSYTVILSQPGEYYISCESHKNISDSTKDMLDGNPIWNYLKVNINDSIKYAVKDSVKNIYGVTDHFYKFTIK